MLKLSDKQKMVADLDNIAEQMIILDGTVGSGKTVAGLCGLMHRAATKPELSGATMYVGVFSDHGWNNTIARTVRFFEAITGLRCPMQNKFFTVPSCTRGAPVRFVKVVCNNIQAASRIQGDTCAGVFATEVVKYPQEVLAEFTFRTRGNTQAKLVYDCNP